jgi:Nucleotidyl transferase AbiEii toxin, Type IV TA system
MSPRGNFCCVLDNATIEEVTLRVVNRTPLRGMLDIETPLGRPDIAARVEVAPRRLWLPAPALSPIVLPVHKGYEFEMPPIPAPSFEEALAEKLAAWRRRRKIRDLYDLYWFGRGVLDEALVRRVLVLKVWHDVVDDGLGAAPFDPATIVEDFNVDDLPPEDIGLLTQPVEPGRWLAGVRARYGFVADLDPIEVPIARCNPADRWRVQEITAALPAVDS